MWCVHCLCMCVEGTDQRELHRPATKISIYVCTCMRVCVRGDNFSLSSHTLSDSAVRVF